LQQLRQLVKELQQRLANVEGGVAAGKPAATNAASSTADVSPTTPAELAGASPQPPAARQEEDQNQGKKPSPLYFESGDIWHSGCKSRNGRCEWSRTLQKIANG
jgi:hypothetical protein